MSTALSFGEWLRQRRKEYGYTQEELADMVGCSPATIRKIESGDRRPSRQVAELLAETLDVPQEERALFIRLARSETPHAPTPSSIAPIWGVPAVAAPSAPAAPHETNGHAPASALSPALAPAIHAPVPVPPPTNLPVQLTPLIGREETVEAVADRLLRDDVRLLTLLGAPGIGKTRLAVEVASQAAPTFPDGVFFVGLASITESDLVTPAIAQAVGMREGSSHTLQAVLIEHMRDKRMLILLDNFEQVVGAAPAVADMLAASPGVKALVTSREALNVRGERQFPVPPLALPNPSTPPTVDVLWEYPAIQLFVERATSVHPSFQLNEENAPAVAALCTRLDGLPLAIELVAARVRLLSPAALLARLDKRLALLTGGQRDLPPRQQTIRSAIEWSYDLLTPVEQTLFARLGIFAGGWTLSAAEAVCNPTGDLDLDAFTGLDSLLNKSLIQQMTKAGEGASSSAEETRFAMLETIREYALERLHERPEVDEIRQAHAEYHLALATAAEPHLLGSDQELWLGRLEAEHDNLRTALSWALDEGEHEFAVSMCGALGRFWSLRGYLTEGRRWLGEVLSRRSVAAPDDRARAFQWAGALARKQDNYEEASDYYGRALILYRELGDMAGTAEVLEHLALVYVRQGDYERGVSLAEEALELSRRLDDKYREARALYMLGGSRVYRNELEVGEQLLREGTVAARTTDNAELISQLLNAVAVAVHWQGRYDEAEELYNEALQRSEQGNDQQNIAQVLGNLGELHLQQGDVDRASQEDRTSLRIYTELGVLLGIAEAITGLAMVAGLRGDPERAAVLHGAADAMRHAIGSPTPPFAVPKREEYVEQARRQTTLELWQAAYNRGAKMPYEQAIALALGE